KHTNPCGLASHDDLAEAYRRALAGDPVSAFGGIVASNRPITLAAGEEINKTHFDAIIAPGFDPKVLEMFRRKKNLRVVELPDLMALGRTQMLDIRRVSGGLLVQTPDVFNDAEFKPKVVTKRSPTDAELKDLFFAWKAVKHVKSNAIVVAKDQALLGMGAGQPNRVVSAHLAVNRAGAAAKGAVAGSDAFFPFPDGVELLAKAGVTAIMQPGGSVKDAEAIAMADRYNVAMVFTGFRHFRH
ncbi:MAG: bifunctional phosphoribosylaminoimidazolecarboxamide formyltransferase/IMP cyclohydrolase, partial [Dehalococcoidia bacterium]|nr:bifunctional phosphoribosylaminoimidazolecarboxamide formyltransferase/IMP cyclohydrolase [Dehalococcoidia bacterium]